MIIRDAVDADVCAITTIYNALVSSTTIAWTESEHPEIERRQWLAAQQAAGSPVLVAVDDHGAVAGFASYGDFRDSAKWPGYRFTVEHTVHVGRDHWQSGVGRQLMTALVERAAVAGKHAMIGAIDAENEASLRFHERLGFTEVARLPETGHKFGRWLDLVLVQRIIDPGGTR